MKKLTSFEQCCAEVNIDPAVTPDVSGILEEFRLANIAHYKLMVIAKALNGDWKPDWNNRDQLKWWPWFYMDSPGFRFDGSNYARSLSNATCGSRLCFPSEELASYAGRHFLEEYKAWLS